MRYKWNWTLKLASFLLLNGAIALFGNGAIARRAVAEPIAKNQIMLYMRRDTMRTVGGKNA